MLDICKFINDVPNFKYDYTFQISTKIDILDPILRLLSSFKQYQLVDYNKIINSNYREYTFNIAMKYYFII